MKKTCIVCRKKKPLEDFRVRTKSKDGRQNKCLDCAKAYDRKVYKDQESRRAAIRANNRASGEENRRRVAEYLFSHPCVDCGEPDILVLDFDHRSRKTKRATISSMICTSYGWNAIQEEIEKCDVRCANCHRRRTAQQQKNWKLKYLGSVG